MTFPDKQELPADSIRNQAPSAFIPRRKILGSLGIAASALCLSPSTADAFLRKKSNDLPIVKVNPAPGDSVTRHIGGFPAEWTRLQGRHLQDYANYIHSLKLRKISAQQVIGAHAKKRGSVWNTLPPKQWWNRMGNTLRVLDRLADEMDMPCKEIVSAYRSPQYNARCPGAKRGSWHQANIALDVQFATRASNVTAAARKLRDRGLFKGGVGSYSTFTHIDTRGVNATW